MTNTSLLQHPVVVAALQFIDGGLAAQMFGPVDEGEPDWAIDDDANPIADPEVAAYDFDVLPPGLDAADDGAVDSLSTLALTWAGFMHSHTPRGYDVFCGGDGWEWARAGDAVDLDVAFGLSKLAARRGAWGDYPARHENGGTKAPPGYHVDDHSDAEFHWSAPDRFNLMLDEHGGSGSRQACLAAAWAHYRRHHETRSR